MTLRGAHRVGRGTASRPVCSIKQDRLPAVNSLGPPAGLGRHALLPPHFTRTQRSSSVSLGHCTTDTFLAIAQVSVRRYSGT